MNKWKLRDVNGYLINRCNRCGEKLLEYNRGFAGMEPICLTCLDKLKAKMPVSNSRAIHKDLVKNHRKEWYFKAINNLIDGVGDVRYTRERWNKLKQIDGK